MTYSFILTLLFNSTVFLILTSTPVKGQNSKIIEKWDRVDYAYLDNTFFQKLPVSHPQYFGDQMGISKSFTISSFENYIKIEKLWISKDRKKYKAEIKYVTSESLDTSDIKNFIFYDSTWFTLLNPEPKGKRIIKKIVNDSLYIFPYYWENKFDNHNHIVDSLYKFKPPYGKYKCDYPGCYICNSVYKKGAKVPATSKNLMFKVFPEKTFILIDYFDNPDQGFYYQINNIRWKPIQYDQVKELSNMIGKIYFQPIGPTNYYYRPDTLGINFNGVEKITEITQSYYYDGIAEPQFIGANNIKGVTLSFNENQLLRNQVYKLEIAIDPRLLSFNKENNAIIPIKLKFSEGLTYETTLKVFK
jgi:hypothetical protein